MRKFFLIPLMTLVCSVMAWGTTRTAGTFQQLQDALEAAAAGDVIELTADITYDGAWSTVSAADLNSATTVVDALCITKSITLDGKGHKIVGWGKHDIGIGSVNGKFHGLKKATLASSAITDASFGDVNTIHRVSLAIHPADANAAIDVVVKNLSVGNKTRNNRYYGIVAFDGVNSLEMDNVTIETNDYSSQQGLCVTGADDTPVDLDIKNTTISAGHSAYCTYFLKPITGKFTNSTINGWAGLYFKYRNIPVYGAVVGSRGSNLTCDACEFNCPNVHDGYSNDFAIFPIEDDGITLTLNNCSMNAEQIGTQAQAVFSLQAMTRTSGYQPVRININGDNTHVYNIKQDSENTDTTAVWNAWAKGEGAYYDVVTGEAGGGGNGKAVNVSLDINITGGTFGMDPRMIEYPKYDGETWGETMTGVTIDLDTYEVKEVSQGGKNVYRVVKRAAEKTPGVMYNLNELVSGEGVSEGVNPTSSFEVLADIQLEQETTKAGHVLVTGGTAENPITVTVPADKNLVVNNGLDVEENAEVVVQPGSALLIGEGGIITANTAGIVLNASEENGAALLLHPEINVNNEPTLTVKMYTDSKQLTASPYRYQYHRFAIPVQALTSAPATNYTSQPLFSGNDEFETYVLSWNGSAWVQENSWTGLQPFTGYLLANNTANGGITYTFTGKLYGNTNDKCEFTDRGFGYFGNSYTAPIYINNFLAGFGEDLEGSVWVYDYTTHNFKAVNATASVFEDAVTEIAPMQSFVLNLPNATTGEAVIDYSSAIWGNPRFDAALGRVSSSAPARSRKAVANASRIKVVAENGMADEVTLIENDTYSAAFENGADATKFIFEEGINLYATTAEGDLSIVATDNLENSSLSFKAGKTTNYTLVVDKAIGEDYAIRDNVTNAVINCAQGAEYTFTQAANSTAIGRFEIVDRNEVPTAIENTEVKANVQGIYTITGMYLGEDLNALPAGVYVVNGVKIVK